MVVEAAVNVMDKVGQELEQKARNSKKQKIQNDLSEIFDRFEELMNLPDSDKSISNRVKLLIKNMFANKDSGW